MQIYSKQFMYKSLCVIIPMNSLFIHLEMSYINNSAHATLIWKHAYFSISEDTGKKYNKISLKVNLNMLISETIV